MCTHRPSNMPYVLKSMKKPKPLFSFHRRHHQPTNNELSWLFSSQINTFLRFSRSHSRNPFSMRRVPLFKCFWWHFCINHFQGYLATPDAFSVSTFLYTPNYEISENTASNPINVTFLAEEVNWWDMKNVIICNLRTSPIQIELQVKLNFFW